MWSLRQNPHILRHTFATISLDETRDIPSTQSALGHARPDQTMAYAKVIAIRDGKAVTAVESAFERAEKECVERGGKTKRG